MTFHGKSGEYEVKDRVATGTRERATSDIAEVGNEEDDDDDTYESADAANEEKRNHVSSAHVDNSSSRNDVNLDVIWPCSTSTCSSKSEATTPATSIPPNSSDLSSDSSSTTSLEALGYHQLTSSSSSSSSVAAAGFISSSTTNPTPPLQQQQQQQQQQPLLSGDGEYLDFMSLKSYMPNFLRKPAEYRDFILSQFPSLNEEFQEMRYIISRLVWVDEHADTERVKARKVCY